MQVPDTDTAEEPNSATTDSLDGVNLVVVSNRQPYRHEFDPDSDRRDVVVERPTGGLTAGLDPVMQSTEGTWVAWGDGEADPEVADEDDCVVVPPEDPSYTLRRIWLDDEAVDEYYYGYSNRGLWPLCHSALTKARFSERFWDTYGAVNERFADAVAEQCGEERSWVWFHDYHLALAPRLLRDRGRSEAVLAHFWHIPWPGADVFEACPQRRDLLDGLLANDLVGFHVDRYVENFLDSVEELLEDAAVDRETGAVHYDGRRTLVRSFPMGVDAERIDRQSASEEATNFWWEFAGEHDLVTPERQLVLGVDRLDYAKGILERFDALERLWEDHPEWRGRFTYVQKGTETRTGIRDYQEYQERIEEAVERLNGRFGTDDWRPVVSLSERLSEEALAGLYRNADVALVSSIRDGMNLVAKEYVAAQHDLDGVLVLSRHAGAHDEPTFAENALTTDPLDTDEFAESIRTALTLAPTDRRRRMTRLRRHVREYDLSWWMDAVFETMNEIESESRLASAFDDD
ncbi:alpha,alpha-trehalose-phosphate synthase (UDP-forming) [Halomarina pelagica]|uniref:alpha,alpha-trehalose-phosphate synthase (UDP-forming) n=1 Tax=Halomarina pelagica TaxID=2961599 RepID=UPI0020C2DBE9|nr:trehalose-6-phosphate synthase [Halomarina sp. BND7]